MTSPDDQITVNYSDGEQFYLSFYLSTIPTFPDAALPGGTALHHVVQNEMKSVIFTKIILIHRPNFWDILVT